MVEPPIDLDGSSSLRTRRLGAAAKRFLAELELPRMPDHSSFRNRRQVLESRVDTARSTSFTATSMNKRTYQPEAPEAVRGDALFPLVARRSLRSGNGDDDLVESWPDDELIRPSR